MSLAAWSVRNRVAVNLLCVLLLVAGWMAADKHLKLDLFPDVSTNFIQITTLDPIIGSAEEIERTVTVPIEVELAGVRGVKKIRSFSEDNYSSIFVEVEPSITDIDPVLNEVRQAVDKAKSKLPASVEPPVIDEFDIPFPLVTFTISFPPGFDVMTIRPDLERLERRLRMIPGVSQVLADGLDRREVWVEVDPHKLETAGLSLEQVAEAVRRKNLNAVAGRLDAAGGQRVIRVVGEILAAGELSDVALKTQNGRTVLLRDVATFRETTEEPRTLGRADMRPAITFTIVKKKGVDAIETVKACRRVFDEETRNLPPEVVKRVLSDSTRFIKVRIGTVVQNGIQALLFVTILLMLMLNWRLALLVAIGIPISFAGVFLVLYVGGYTINLLSLFGMIMALGMVVDDAVVMAENSYRHLQSGEPPTQAAIEGSREVFWPVLGSVSTTVAAFLPLIWAEGIIGKFLMIVPVVVISALVFSIIQAFVVLPSHLADFVKRGKSAAELAALPPARGWGRISRSISVHYRDLRDAVDRLLKTVVSIYLHLLSIALRWRYAAAIVFLSLLVAAGGLVAAGLVPFKLFSTDFADLIFVKAELPADFSLKQTSEAVSRLERRIAETLPAADVLSIITRVGARFDPSNDFLEYGTNLALVTVDIDEENPKCRKPSEIARALRRILPEFPEFTQLTVQIEEGGPPVGRAVNIELGGASYPALLAAAADVERRLEKIPGVYNVGDDFPRGKTEFRVRVDPAKADQAGLDATSVSRALQGAFYGLEAGRMRWGNEEVVLRVKFAEAKAQDPEVLHSLKIINRRGEPVPLDSIASMEQTTGVSRIKRSNQERVVTVSADVDSKAVTSAKANAMIAEWIAEIEAAHPGIGITLSGESEDTDRSVESMKFAAVVAMLLIYGLLAVITNSFLQPVVIMAVIPFGIVGVIFGLLAMGQPIGLMSIMGTVALAGIVVNNSVVMVDFINQYRNKAAHLTKSLERQAAFPCESFPRWRSILQSAALRFRPVFLTSATTVVGLLSLAFTTSGQEQFLAPMAQAIVFGLTFATLITLVLIPCLYAILDDFHGLTRSRSKSRSGS
ncbi:MAG: efflux RND transporter permease subunit [Verrucomicrobiota bacterium]